jgi:hypothetical protein
MASASVQKKTYSGFLTKDYESNWNLVHTCCKHGPWSAVGRTTSMKIKYHNAHCHFKLETNELNTVQQYMIQTEG